MSPRGPGQAELGRLLDHALAARQMSLTHLHRRLADRGFGVSLSSLSYWRAGRRRPASPSSLDALTEIEAILDLRPGTLLDARGPAVRAGPRPPGLPVTEVVPAEVPVQAALAELGLADWDRYLVEDAVHVVSDVDVRGQATHFASRIRLKAVADCARSYPLYVFAGEPVPEPLVLAGVMGAEVTGAVVDDAAGLALWRLRLPRALAAGETAMIEADVRLADLDEPESELIYHAVRRLSEFTMWVRFDPRRLPRACRTCIQHGRDEALESPVDLDGMNSAHLVLSRFGPGRAGFVMDWSS